MKTRPHQVQLALTALFVASLLLPSVSEAQRMKHSAPAGRSKSRPSSGSPGSINGGAKKSASRPAPTTPSTGAKQPAGKGPDTAKQPDTGNKANAGNKTDGGNKANTGNKTNTGNKVNVDNSQKNVNINVDNSKDIHINNQHNTMVRHGGHPYARPPYAYGGHHYYCHSPYHYHPYKPYYWGPVYHPWGFFVATMAATAIIVSVNNQQVHYDQGVYYMAGNGGYTVVSAPVGATITTLPPNTQTVVVNETTNNYYYGGTYYEKTGEGYTVVAPTAGTIVESLPEGGEEVKLGDVTYVKVGETYYQPTQKDGKDVYEVVQVEAGEK